MGLLRRGRGPVNQGALLQPGQQQMQSQQGQQSGLLRPNRNILQQQAQSQPQPGSTVSQNDLDLAVKKGIQDELTGGSRSFDNEEVQAAYLRARELAAKADRSALIAAQRGRYFNSEFYRLSQQGAVASTEVNGQEGVLVNTGTSKDGKLQQTKIITRPNQNYERPEVLARMPTMAEQSRSQSLPPQSRSQQYQTERNINAPVVTDGNGNVSPGRRITFGLYNLGNDNSRRTNNYNTLDYEENQLEVRDATPKTPVAKLKNKVSRLYSSPNLGKQFVGGLGKASISILETPYYLLKDPQAFVKGSAGGIKQLTTDLFSTGGRGTPELNANIRERPAGITGIVVANILTTKGLSKTVNTLNQDVPLKIDLPREPRFTSTAKIVNLRRGENSLDIAQFTVKGTKAPRYAFTVKRYDLIRANIARIEPRASKTYGELTYRELQQIFPRGKKITVEPRAVALSTTEPFIVENGIVSRPVRSGVPAVGVLTKKGTLKRIEPTTLSQLTGGIRRQPIDLRSVNRAYLDPINRAALERIETAAYVNPGRTKYRTRTGDLFIIETKRKTPAISNIFAKDAVVETGEIVTKDLLRIDSKGRIKYIPEGKRLSRAEITSLSQTKGLTKFDSREYGLKEYEELAESIGVVDTTRPRFRLPKKVSLIQARVQRFEYELPEIGGTSNAIITKRPIRTPEQLARLMQERQATLTAVRQQIALGSLKQAKALSPRRTSISKALKQQQEFNRLSNLPSIVGGSGIARSAFTGQNAYEQSQAASLFYGRPSITASAVYNPQAEITKLNTPVRYASIPRELTRQIPINIIRSIPREVTRTLPKNISRTISRLIPRTVNRTITRTIPRQITRTAKRTVPRIVTRFVPKLLPRIPSRQKKYRLPRLPGTQAYRPYVIRRGRKIYLSGLGTRAEALTKAQRQATRSLAATFGADPVNARVQASKTRFNPNRFLFRGYKIKQGKRIRLDNQYIQRQTKRLSFRSEVRELLASRRIR